MELERLPDPWLDPESLAHANEMFYSSEPHVYFHNRLALLVLAAGKPEVVEEAVRGGIEYEGLFMRGGDEPQAGDDEGDDKEERRHRQFVIAETLTLLHHVSETVVRLYLAHEALPDCPWIALAKQPPMEAFKRDVVGKRFDGKPLTRRRRKALAQVFYGSERPRPGDVSEEEWDASLDDLERWLGRFASHFLRDAQVWNAVKHGLAIQPGEPYMQVKTPADDAEGRDPPLIHAKGPGVTFLEKRGPDRLWHISTKWLQPFTPGHLMGEIQMATYLLESIWQVGRARYLGEVQTLRIYWPPKFQAFMDTADSGVITNYMSINMLYSWAYPPDLECSACHRKPTDGERARLTWRMYRDADGTPCVLCRECASDYEQSDTGQGG